jgi:hypothetical protein
VAVLIGDTASDPMNQTTVATLRDRLLELGWSGSGNLRIESRFGEGDLARGPLRAAELVGLNPDVIHTAGRNCKSKRMRFRSCSRASPIVLPPVPWRALRGPVATQPDF